MSAQVAKMNRAAEAKCQLKSLLQCKTSSDAIQEALKKREEQVQGCLLPNGLNQPAQKYNGRNLGSIRLVFQLSFSDNGYCHYLQPIFSDVIADITQMPIKEEIRVVFELSVESSETTVRVSGCVKKVMKHLIIVTVPDVQMYVNTERTKAKVLVEQNLPKTEDSTNSALTIAFLPGAQV
uniref:DnaJ_C domain-containing protein n=1 Tax=Macrostomum lignano TaxID=282301 RepID=A0A1I8GJG7_9PLAT